MGAAGRPLGPYCSYAIYASAAAPPNAHINNPARALFWNCVAVPCGREKRVSGSHVVVTVIYSVCVEVCSISERVLVVLSLPLSEILFFWWSFLQLVTLLPLGLLPRPGKCVTHLRSCSVTRSYIHFPRRLFVELLSPLLLIRGVVKSCTTKSTLAL